MSDLVRSPEQSPPSNQNPALVYLSGLNGKQSKVSQLWALKAAVRLVVKHNRLGIEAFPWKEMRFEHMQALRGTAAARYAPATANRILHAVRGTLKAAWQLRQIPHGEYLLSASVKPVPDHSREQAGRALSDAEVLALFQACLGDSVRSIRDRALLTLAYCCGLRRSEIAGLTLESYAPETGKVSVKGKGGRTRSLYLSSRGRLHLSAWLAVRGKKPGPLLCAISRWGTPAPRRNRISVSAVRLRLHALGAAAGIEKFSPHDLRRTFITHLLDRGIDLNTVRQLAGHSSISTTIIYDRRGEVTLQKAITVVDTPV